MLSIFLFLISRITFIKNSFFPSMIIEWNNLDSKLWNSENFDIFKNNILTFIRPKPNSFFNCNKEGTIYVFSINFQLLLSKFVAPKQGTPLSILP